MKWYYPLNTSWFHVTATLVWKMYVYLHIKIRGRKNLKYELAAQLHWVAERELVLISMGFFFQGEVDCVFWLKNSVQLMTGNRIRSRRMCDLRDMCRLNQAVRSAWFVLLVPLLRFSWLCIELIPNYSDSKGKYVNYSTMTLLFRSSIYYQILKFKKMRWQTSRNAARHGILKWCISV